MKNNINLTFDELLKRNCKMPYLTMFLSLLLVVGETCLFYFIYVKKIDQSTIKNTNFIINTTFWVFIMIFTTPFSLNYIFLTAISIKSFSFNKKIIKNLCIINKNTDKPKNLPKIALLHLVCDDFLPYFCKKCFSQDYQNIDYFICDDSKKLEKIMEIDKFANENKCNVCRRSSKHKNSYYGRAGNWYNFVQKYADKYDYIIFTDSGTVIQNDFASYNVNFFNATNNEKLAAIQSHICSFPKNNFFSIYHNFFWEFSSVQFIGWNTHFRSPTSGFGVIFKSSILKNIEIEKIMCSVDDDATTTYLYSRGYNILVSPISISSKIRPFNNISFWKQQSKWLHGAGDQIIFLKTMKTNRKIRDIPLKLYIYSYLEKISPFILSINTIVIIFFSGFFILYNYLENGRNFFVFVPAIWAPLYLFLFLGISKMIIDLWILYRQKKIIKRFFFVFLGLISLLIDSYVVGIIYFIVFIKKWILHIRKTKQTNIPTDKYNYYIKKRSILKYLLPFYSICIFVTLILLTFFTLYYLDIKPFSNDDFVLYFTITSLCTTWIPILVITIVCLFTNKLSKNPKYNKLPESPTDWSQNPYKDLIEKWK